MNIIFRKAKIGQAPRLSGPSLMFRDNLDDENARPLQRKFLEDWQQESNDVISLIRTGAEWPFGNLRSS
jgi:hypothetical protein